MFEITTDDIASLNDSDLRILICKLCRAELKQKGFSTAWVLCGGDQDAPDGGVDVRVKLPPGKEIEGYIPRRETVFQVKKPDMQPKDIEKEMRPKGEIRSAIKELSNQSGAYIIASSQSSTTDSALKLRERAMVAAVKDVENSSMLELAFYDSGKIAAWVEEHVGISIWLRRKVGRARQGWQPYGAWALDPKGESGEYFRDDALRIHPPRRKGSSGLSVADGINKIRDLLGAPGNSVRLVGLSGVGKTRLVQALFEEGVGDNSLDPSLAIYTDTATTMPDPEPFTLASNLAAEGSRAIMVIDNCESSLHERLTTLCKKEGIISVITVEFDIREDEPVGSEVFKLEPSSIGLLENLIKYRFPHVSQVDSKRIAEFSGGNSKIAIALAATISEDESISGIANDILFRRLFEQRHGQDESLYKKAQALSLVYSFNSEVSNGDVTEERSELHRLGSLVASSEVEMYQCSSELKRREILQDRGVWRAILPQAIANRLARTALEDIPLRTINSHLVLGAPVRLLKSFSSRLGYLHDSEKGKEIITGWLKQEGILGQLGRLNSFGIEILMNVAPAAPEGVLAKLELASESQNQAEVLTKFIDLSRMIRSIAYEEEFFESSVALLVKTISFNISSYRIQEVKDIFKSLFFIRLSGTHAPIEQRLKIIKELLHSSDPIHQDLSVLALDSVLESWEIVTSYEFEFGARSRDYGYFPKDQTDVEHWYRSTFKLIENIVNSDNSVKSRVVELLARKFQGIWIRGQVYSELEHICKVIAEKGFWREGWIAVRRTQISYSSQLSQEVSMRLEKLEELLRPSNLEDKIQSIVLSRGLPDVDIDDLIEGDEDDPVSAFERADALAMRLGEEVALDNATFEKISEDLVSKEGRLFDFGRGLAKASSDPDELWNKLVEQLKRIPSDDQRVMVLAGFIYELNESDPTHASRILDDALLDEAIVRFFPYLQASIVLDSKGIERLKKSVADPRIPVFMFRNLSFGSKTTGIPSPDFEELILSILEKPEGDSVAIELLAYRLYSYKKDGSVPAPEILSTGRSLLKRLSFSSGSDRDDYHLKEIAVASLKGIESESIVTEVCRKLGPAIREYKTRLWDHVHLLEAILESHPIPALDTLLNSEYSMFVDDYRDIHFFTRNFKNPFDSLSESIVVEWCEDDPILRCPRLAAAITPFSQPKEDARPEWKPIALKVLDISPEKMDIWKQYIRHVSPTSWSGSRASIMDANLRLVKQLVGRYDPTFDIFLNQEILQLEQEIQVTHESEQNEYQSRHERFE